MAQLMDNSQAYMNLQRGGSLYNPDNGISVKKDVTSNEETTVYIVIDTELKTFGLTTNFAEAYKYYTGFTREK
jgi:hypothetical protein